ncbi:5-formyltetrahydrofolate cyclo-ligase [Blautia sp. An249]|uniref:5-formyltetrahydrofolate cyclo-ligase n=1 Tax=Blautia sp. An249 TaxID=1965603 RepID=UPI000B37A0AC|nr:5-formyltetrahydrofolate cyclo-ligase [Blautia sp. An249]OUO80204.1 5-formyltetrahydrofolate cyclo-ligase [Blautia sp. An249]
MTKEESIKTQKKAIRKEIFSRRKQITLEELETFSQAITEKVAQLEAFQKSGHIYIYADYNHEVITRYLIEKAWSLGKEVAVPKVVGEAMVFYKLKDFAQLKPGYFGIPEPEDGEIVTWEEAFMVMPGVAFDPMNHRVGYGGGFYDRFLEKHPKVLKAALAFECQIMPEVPYEATDIFPDWVVTEKRVLIKEG